MGISRYEWSFAASSPMMLFGQGRPGVPEMVMRQARDGGWSLSVSYDRSRNQAQWVGMDPERLLETACRDWGLLAEMEEIIDAFTKAVSALRVA